MENKTKQELLDEAGKLADRHNELKSFVIDLLNEMDRIQIEYIKIKEQLKNG